MEFTKQVFKQVVALADTLIVIIDPEGRIRLFNRKAEEITGYSAEEVIGKLWSEVLVPEAYRPRFQRVSDALTRNVSLLRREEYPIRAKDGQLVPVEWDRTLIKDEKGETQAILSIGHVLLLNMMLEETKACTETILDSISEGVVTVDKELRITSFNKAAAHITGLPVREALGRPCSEVLRTSLCGKQCPFSGGVGKGKQIVDVEMIIRDQEGREVPVSMSTAVLRDRGGLPIGGVEVFRDLSLISELKKELAGRYSYQDIISRNKAFRDIFRHLPDIAQSDAAVLVGGESGTGKELVATALHNLSARRDKPLVKVNCSALPETLLESELFGYKRGAFTDARHDKPGRFRMADGGSLFLDEIADMSLGTQAKLLRVLETKEFIPLGGTGVERVDVRIVSASNKDLWELVRLGQFREDLFYRINVVSIEIPPLRERREDIRLLLDHFLHRFNVLKDRHISGFTQSALKILMNHEYPGNVRELQNIVEHTFILCKSSRITPQCLPTYLQKRPSIHPRPRPQAAIQEYEKQLIQETLKACGGNMAEAADKLGIHRSTLWRKLKRMNRD